MAKIRFFFAFLLCCLSNEIHGKKRIPCPPKEVGGLLTSGDPEFPDPFHDVTVEELSRVYQFLEVRPGLNLTPAPNATVNSSYIFMVDLLLPPKKKVLDFLDTDGKKQPKREARVMIFRGDKSPPVAEEYRVGPLSKPKYLKLIKSSKRRNPAPFAFRPSGLIEGQAFFTHLLPKVEEEVSFILRESYGGSFFNCTTECLALLSFPKGSALVGELSRMIWATATYSAELYSLYPLDFGVLVNLTSSDPAQWSVEQVWYSNAFYPSLSELADRYRNDPLIPKSNRTLVPADQPEEFSTITQRGGPYPEEKMRPPVQLELDGKRYSVTYRHVQWLQWSLHVGLSSFRGPQVYDARYRGQRIAYELGVADIAVFYAGEDNSVPFKITDYVDSGVLLGTHAKALVEGADCPKGATFLAASFLGERMEEATTFNRSMCVFEHDTGLPLFRHMAYRQGQGAFYGGMTDTVLIFRTILAIDNYDYNIDFIFRQDGSVESRVTLSGTIYSTVPGGEPGPHLHGWNLRQHVHGNLHHHMFHFKVDLDIGNSTSNRYETLNYSAERITLPQDGKPYNQINFIRDLKETEKEAVFDFNFDAPKTHLVYNENETSEFGAPRAYSIVHKGMSKQLLPEDEFNVRSIPWSHHQMAVTLRKEEEALAGSSSPYTMFDSLDPVVNFTEFFSDDDNIVDKDLVFWVTMGRYHLPHTEDLPVTPTGGGHLSFFLVPHNFYPENPALSSRDLVLARLRRDKDGGSGNDEEEKDKKRKKKNKKKKSMIRVEATLVKKDDFCDRMNLRQLAASNPDALLQATRPIHLL